MYDWQKFGAKKIYYPYKMDTYPTILRMMYHNKWNNDNPNYGKMPFFIILDKAKDTTHFCLTSKYVGLV